MYMYPSTHHWVVMVSASSFSPIFLRPVCSTLQDGTPTWLTLSCRCSQAASIFIVHLFTSPRCSSSILSSLGYRSPSSRPRDCQLLKYFKNLFTFTRSSIPVYIYIEEYHCHIEQLVHMCILCDLLRLLEPVAVSLERPSVVSLRSSRSSSFNSATSCTHTREMNTLSHDTVQPHPLLLPEDSCQQRYSDCPNTLWVHCTPVASS